jgi:hypothetical protein
VELTMMAATFTNTVRILVESYKQLLKNHLGLSACNKKLKELGLKKKILKHDSEITLYFKMKTLIQDIETWLATSSEAQELGQIKDFYTQTKYLLEHFYFDNDRVVHIHQKASRAIVRSIQLMSANDFDSAILNELQECTQVIAQFGHEDQHKIFLKALQKYAEETPHIFRQLSIAFKENISKTKTLIEEPCYS